MQHVDIRLVQILVDSTHRSRSIDGVDYAAWWSCVSENSEEVNFVWVNFETESSRRFRTPISKFVLFLFSKIC